MANIHPTADVQSRSIGARTLIWQFVVVLPGAVIGENCNINCHVFIENDVVIGDNVTIKSGVQLWDGVRLENNVFVGPNVTFTNDLVPRSKVHSRTPVHTVVEEGASIGANATVVAGHIIGRRSLIGAGSVVTKDVPAFQVWYGNPAVHKGYVTSDGVIVSMDLTDAHGQKYILGSEGPAKAG